MLNVHRLGSRLFQTCSTGSVLVLAASGFLAPAFGQSMSAERTRPQDQAPDAVRLPTQPTGPHVPAPPPVHVPSQKTGPHDPAPPAEPFPAHKTGPHDPAPPARPLPQQPTGPDQPAPGPVYAPSAFCFGDGSGSACPCGNIGLVGHGCDNSAATGGAQLELRGMTHVKLDTAVLNAYGELPSSLSIVFQGDAEVRPAHFGDGLRCVGGNLLRLYVYSASGGVVSAPQKGDSSISARSAEFGDTLLPGDVRYYQIYYRDPNPRFCAGPDGDTFNVSNALAVTWSG